MVFREDAPWFRHFSCGALSSGGAGAKEEEDPWEDSDVDRRQRERGFDIADAMERGLAREVSTDFVYPLRRARNLWRFHVIRSEDKLEHRLFSEEGEFLIFAKTFAKEGRVDFFMHNSNEDDYDPSRPAFTMAFNKDKTQWRLTKRECELCQYRSKHRSCGHLGKQQLAHVEQVRQPIGEGIFNCMEVAIPGLFADGSRVVFCPAAGYDNLASSLSSPVDSHEAMCLATKRPVWNEEVECLVLDFKGRTVEASAKNFQLALPERPDQIICQFGKIGPSVFGLDFGFPLSVIQGFAISLSTMYWT